jgi:hypothetical protein
MRGPATLARANIPREIVYTSASLLGVIAAAEAGFAITVLGRSTLTSNLRETQNLLLLGTAEMAILESVQKHIHS